MSKIENVKEEDQMRCPLTAYAVDLDEIRRVLGAGDAALADHHAAGFVASWAHDELWDQPEFLEEFVQDALEDDGEDVDTAEVLRGVARTMILGGQPDNRLDFIYKCFIEYLCEGLGTGLIGEAWGEVSLEFIDEVQRAWQHAGLPPGAVSTATIAYGQRPNPLPDLIDIGYVDTTDVERWLQDLSAVDLDRIPDADDHDKYCRQAAEDLIGWLKQCHAESKSLVCFFDL